MGSCGTGTPHHQVKSSSTCFLHVKDKLILRSKKFSTRVPRIWLLKTCQPQICPYKMVSLTWSLCSSLGINPLALTHLAHQPISPSASGLNLGNRDDTGLLGGDIRPSQAPDFVGKKLIGYRLIWRVSCYNCRRKKRRNQQECNAVSIWPHDQAVLKAYISP